MYERQLEQAYERLLEAYRVMLAAGGPARCNGEWARWAAVRAQVQELESGMAYETRESRATAAPHPHHGA